MIKLALFATLLFSSLGQAKIKLAITVDDLPKHSELPSGTNRKEVAEKMLAAFKSHNIVEVYGFINAEPLKSDPSLDEVLKLWTSFSYPLGNHSYSHQSLNKISAQDFEREIELNEETLKRHSHDQDWHFFRYPYLHEGENLEKRNLIRTYLKEKSYKIAQVTIDFADWSWNEPYARCLNAKNLKAIAWLKKSYLTCASDQLHRADKISRALFKKQGAQILLLHIGAFDAEMIPALLELYKKEGVEFITLADALKDSSYTIDPGFTSVGGSEFTYQILKSRGLKLKDIGMAPYAHYPEKKLTTICR